MSFWWFGAACVVSLLWLSVGIWPIIRTGRSKYEQFLHTDEESRNWLLRFIREAKKEVVVVSGNFNPNVFNQELVDVIVQKLTENQAIKIFLLGSSKVFTREGANWIMSLVDRQPVFGGRLIVRFLAERPIHHFRIADATHLYLEDPHPSFSSFYRTNHMASVLRNSFFKVWFWRGFFEKIWNEKERAELSQLQFVPIEGV